MSPHNKSCCLQATTPPTNAPTFKPSTNQPPATVTIRVDFTFANFPEDISWTLINTCDGENVKVASSGNYGGQPEISESYYNVWDGTFVWEVNDSYGDGGLISSRVHP